MTTVLPVRARFRGQHHDAVGGGAAGVARDGVEFRGVRSAALLAAGDFGLAEVHEGHVILRRAGEAAAPQLFAGGLLIEGPDGVAELGVGSFGGFRFGSISTVPKSFGMTVMFFTTVSPPTVKVTSCAPAAAL